MDHKTVGKSRSYNVPLQKLKRDNKSQSNAGFQPLIMKKRGVYVEKKVKSSTDTQNANSIQIKKKPPPRPRPGQKKFLASVLTILSKSTTGTQYPDIQEEDRTKFKSSKPRWKTNDMEESSKTVQKINKTKKTKFKSRVLNDEILRAEKEQLIILQSRKDITQTPSNYSAKSKATDSIKWSDILHIENEQPKRNPIRDILENNIYSGVAEGITKEVLEGRTKDKKLRINDDPETLASKIAKKDDKQLYNFFVDLLETTISVYNVKTDSEPGDGSEILLEVNDSIAKKLEFKNESHENVKRIIKRNSIDENEKQVYHSKENIPIDIKLSEYNPLPPIKRKIKAKSFIYPYSRKAKIPSKSNSFEMKTKIRKPKKKALLDLLKEQLEMDTYTYEEPETLYDALKVMARNNQRCEKSIHFDKKSNINNDLDSECMFQRRNVLSFKAKKKGKARHNTEFGSRHIYDEKVKKASNCPSHHSLEVFGYDYEEPIKRLEVPQHRRVIFTYHSTPSGSDSDLDDCNALIDYPDSTASSD